MPSSLVLDMDSMSQGQLEADQRALQIALELSMLGLTNDEDSNPNFDDLRSKKSMNMTECVPVPSSEHVAEIVGRQGCKIKALRAKTNTYIKTPVRGEDPVFVVTGRKEDVTLAKREIISAAEHFSQIRAQRKNNSLNSLAPGPPSPSVPGQSTILVRVPYRVVGLVVGPKGATIKRIQQQTNTYIVTPSRDKEPVFEVTGSGENVESARNEILNHISNRTGGLLDANDDSVFHNGDLNSFNDFRPGSIYSSGSQSGFSSLRDSTSLSQSRSHSSDSFYYQNGSTKNEGFNPINSPFSPNGFFFSDFPSPTDRDVGSDANSSGSGGFDPAPTPPSPSIWAPVTSALSNARELPYSRSSSVTSSSLQSAIGRPASPRDTIRRLKSEALPGSAFSALQAFTPFTAPSTSPTISDSTIANGSVLGSTTPVEAIGTRPSLTTETNNNQTTKDKKKDCVVCYENEIVAALVPCGHNLFCMECADRIRDEHSVCPVCQKHVTQVLRIFS
ncbi:RNA-binding protein MEX3B [Nematostella vectensis]|nr:RNA-binding protein MEX3B [Nematostella vectensis]